IALVCAGSTQPAAAWILDVASGAMRQLTHSPHPGVDLSKLVRPELVRFKAHDGLDLSGWFYRPAGASAPYPTVLSFHGGPEGQERPFFSSQYQALLARGIAVFAPNVRGSSGFGKKFVNLDNGELRFKGVRDIEACVAAAVKSGADPKRIGIMGGSYGGHKVMGRPTRDPQPLPPGAGPFRGANISYLLKQPAPPLAA